MHKVLADEIASYSMEKRYLHADGHEVWINLSVSLVRDDGGAPLYFVSQIEDVTERKRVEEAWLRESATVGPPRAGRGRRERSGARRRMRSR